MTVVFNHMQDWIFEMKDLSLVSKLLLERMISLSSDGKQQVFINRDDFAQKLGISIKSIGRSFKQLVEFELIEEVKNTNPFNRTKNFKITAKALSDRKGQIVPIEKDKMSLSTEQKSLVREGKNVSLHKDKKSLSSLDRKIDKKYRKKERGALSETHSFEEVFDLFTTNAEELSKDYPILKSMNLKLIADKYFNYREEQKWKGVKDLSLNVTNWLIDEIKHLQTTPTQTTKKGDFFGNLNKLVQMNSPETLEVSQGKKIIDVDASIVTD